MKTYGKGTYEKGQTCIECILIAFLVALVVVILLGLAFFPDELKEFLRGWGA